MYSKETRRKRSGHFVGQNARASKQCHKVDPHGTEKSQVFRCTSSNSSIRARCIIEPKLFFGDHMTELESAQALARLMREYQSGNLAAFEA